MVFKSKQILLKCDFIGYIPELRILDEARYKSIFSSILSILLIIFSIIFVTYSFIEYLNQNPKIEYYKNNDYSTNKTYAISDSFLMFHYSFFCLSDISEMPNVEVFSEKGRIHLERLSFKPCELGKSLNIKYKEVVEKFEKIDRWKLERYYCIDYNGSDLTLFSHPSDSSDYENLLQIRILSKCKDYTLFFKLLTENDFIDHNQKENPIVPFYEKNELTLRNDKKYLVYNYQYIRYETDNGFLFNDKKIFNGIGTSFSNQLERTDLTDSILNIIFKMNRSNYDLYRRTFVKFQSFLAEVMSLINLLIAICKVITEYLLYKKMHKDIIKYILINKNNNEIKENISKGKKLKKIFDFDNNNNEKFEKKVDKNEIIEEKSNSKISFDIPKKDKVLEYENLDKNTIKVMKNLNFINIIKSFFCSKDKKLKLINMCNNIVTKDICIEKILKRLYVLESEYNLLMKDNPNKSFINGDNDIYKIKKIITKIYDESNKKPKN